MFLFTFNKIEGGRPGCCRPSSIFQARPIRRSNCGRPSPGSDTAVWTGKAPALSRRAGCSSLGPAAIELARRKSLYSWARARDAKPGRLGRSSSHGAGLRVGRGGPGSPTRSRLRLGVAAPALRLGAHPHNPAPGPPPPNPLGKIVKTAAVRVGNTNEK